MVSYDFIWFSCDFRWLHMILHGFHLIVYGFHVILYGCHHFFLGTVISRPPRIRPRDSPKAGCRSPQPLTLLSVHDIATHQRVPGWRPTSRIAQHQLFCSLPLMSGSPLFRKSHLEVCGLTCFRARSSPHSLQQPKS